MTNKQAEATPAQVARAVYSALLTEVGLTRAGNKKEMDRAERENFDRSREDHREAMGALMDPARHTRVPVLLRQGGPIPSEAVPPGFDEGMVRVASVAGAALAKVAFPGSPTQLVGSAQKAVQGVAQKAKGMLAKAPAPKPAVVNASPFKESPIGSAGLFPVKAPNVSAGVKAPTADTGAAQIDALHQKFVKAPTTPYRQPAPAPTQTPAPAPAAPTQTPPPAPTGNEEPKGMLGRLKDIYSSGKLPGQLLGLGAVGAAGYGGYKLLRKGLDVLGQEHQHPAVYGQGAPQLAMQVNQYGEPQL